MKFELNACSRLINKKSVKTTSCAAVVYALDDNGQRVFKRAMGFGAGSLTLNLASLLSAQLALLSIEESLLAGDPLIILRTDSRYVVDVLVKTETGYRIKPSSNVEAVKALRAVHSKFKNLSIVCEKFVDSEPYSYECANLAQRVAVSQVAYDSGVESVPLQ